MDDTTKADPFLPGSVGSITDPRLPITVNQVRPYLVAILLHHGSLRLEDALASISPHCNSSDLKIALYVENEDEHDIDLNHLEKAVLTALRSMEDCGIVIYNNYGKSWHLQAEEKSKSLPVILNWVSSMGAQLPSSLKL